ncbi:MAG: sigma-54-dependent Fis family transcriptional regulator [Sandaracinaceae bacterium]|nr:sigma-54-dependent Fis family transcriptional regulator [Sandaracinaceae bacterium]
MSSAEPLRADRALREDDEPRGRILVVDDEDDLCLLIAMRLEHHGYAVSTETSCRGAIELLSRELFDAVVLDLRLEDGDGLDLLGHIQEMDPELPVVMLTAHGSIEAAVAAMERGAYGFLTKPFHDHELLQKLAHALEGAHLRREVAGFRRMVGEGSNDARLLGSSPAIAEVRERIARLAPTDATVLVTGESGTGKELAARSLHALSGRREGPLVTVNCAAMPAELLESELFGHVRGAFTGAQRDKKGLFAVADGGSIFLDEIGDAPLAVQAKLLRVLQERRFLPLGATSEEQSDVRVIAATNRDLQADVAAGRFREDLFYRLHVVPIRMPPLRDRREDIPLLAEVFLRRAATQHGLGRCLLQSDAVRLLLRHTWPGNVRELANVIQGAAVLARDGRVGPEELAAVLSLPIERDVGTATPSIDARGVIGVPRNELGEPLPMREAREVFDREYLCAILRREKGNVSAAARVAGRNRTDLHDLLRRHGIDADAFRQ